MAWPEGLPSLHLTTILQFHKERLDMLLPHHQPSQSHLELGWPEATLCSSMFSYETPESFSPSTDSVCEQCNPDAVSKHCDLIAGLFLPYFLLHPAGWDGNLATHGQYREVPRPSLTAPLFPQAHRGDDMGLKLSCLKGEVKAGGSGGEGTGSQTDKVERVKVWITDLERERQPQYTVGVL